MNRAARVALIAGAGYLIGRRHKLWLSLVIGAAVAGGRMSARPGGLLGQGAELMRDSDSLGRIAGLSGPLAAAGKAAVASAASSTIESVSDRLRDRTESIRQGSSAASRDRSRDAGAEQERGGLPSRGRANQGGADRGGRDQGEGGGQARAGDGGRLRKGAGETVSAAAKPERRSPRATPVTRRGSTRTAGSSAAPVRRRAR